VDGIVFMVFHNLGIYWAKAGHTALIGNKDRNQAAITQGAGHLSQSLCLLGVVL